MTSTRHRPRRRFGQHFLRDIHAIEQIVTAIRPTPDEHFVEIGPGDGALTAALLPHVAVLDAVEIDRDLAAMLKARFGDEERLRVHTADILELELASLAANRGERLRIVGNLPYNITTPILFKLLAESARVADIHVLLQREVVARAVAQPGGSEYGRLSVMLQIACEVENLFDVPAHAFDPPPKVTSALLRLRPRPRGIVHIADRDVFAMVVREAFSQRRKTIRNALRQHFDAKQIEAIGIDPRARPETLGLADFAALSNALSARRPHAGTGGGPPA